MSTRELTDGSRAHAREPVETICSVMQMKPSRRHRRTLSRPVRLTLVAIVATTVLVIGWIAALNWNWLAPSIHDAMPRHEAQAPYHSPAG